MASYGIPYQGSKSRIAEWVIDHLPVSDTLVDLFAGGCAITHCAMLSGKFKRIICNDLDGRGVRLFESCVNGTINLHKVVTRKVFKEERDKDFLVSITGSFGNDNDSYLYGGENKHKELAEVMLFGETIKEKYDAYKMFVKHICQSKDNTKKGFGDLARLQRLERLERIERIRHLVKEEGAERVTYTTTDYKVVKIPDNAIVYCDPPYKNTRRYFKQRFNHDEFYDWCLSCDFPVFVSEFDMPQGFTCIDVISRHSTRCTDKSTFVVEKLYVQDRQLDRVRSMQCCLF